MQICFDYVAQEAQISHGIVLSERAAPHVRNEMTTIMMVINSTKSNALLLQL